MKKFKTGLVLSGGGTRGFAHLGVVSALYEAGIVPDVISGVSAGAIAGAFIASGEKPENIHETLKKGTFFKYTKIQIPKDGLFRLEGLKQIIGKEIKAKNIQDLKIPLFVGISNLNNGRMEYRSKGDLAETVLASSSIPILFSPVKIDDGWYVDGGLLDNLPVRPIKNSCEKIIVVNLNPVPPVDHFKNLAQVASRSFYMSVNSTLEYVLKYTSLYIEPEGIENSELFSTSNADKTFEMGYNTTKKQLQGVKWDE